MQVPEAPHQPQGPRLAQVPHWVIAPQFTGGGGGASIPRSAGGGAVSTGGVASAGGIAASAGISGTSEVAQAPQSRAARDQSRFVPRISMPYRGATAGVSSADRDNPFASRRHRPPGDRGDHAVGLRPKPHTQSPAAASEGSTTRAVRSAKTMLLRPSALASSPETFTRDFTAVTSQLA